VLIEARREQIDHFENGYVLMWERRGDPTTIRRREVFDQAWKLRSAHEFILSADRTLAWGNLLIATDGQPLLCAWTFLSEETKWNVIIRDEVPQADHWELQLLEPEVAECRYRSDKTNFSAFQVGPMRGLHSVPEDARLINGIDCPHIGHLRDNPFESRRSEQ